LAAPEGFRVVHAHFTIVTVLRPEVFRARRPGFLGSLLTCAISAPEGLLYYRASAVPADLPTGPIPLPFNELFRQFQPKTMEEKLQGG
jgi:hypothetical protein